MAKTKAASPRELVLPKFPSAKEQKNPGKGVRNWMAICPTHNDTNPSLSITEGSDGRITFYCFANHGCTHDGVVEAIGLKLFQMYPGSYEVTGPGNKKETIDQTYEYTDESGNLIYQVVRYVTPKGAPKKFRQRRPDSSGGWTQNLDGISSLLYHLPDVIASKKLGKRVYICEGEKDVDNVRALGLEATTNSNGAKGWKKQFCDFFQGVNVVILEDNDKAGEERTAIIAPQLEVVAKSVKVIQFPDIPKEGDVSDWIEAGGTKEKLEEIADECPEWRAVTDPNSDKYVRNFEIDKIEKVGRTGSLYYVYVLGHSVKMSASDLSCFASFCTKVMGTADRRPHMNNPKDWGKYIDKCLQEKLVKIDIPDDADKEGLIWHHVCRYMKKADENESALAEKRAPWSNERFFYLHGPSLQQFLQVVGIRFESESELWDLVRKKGGTNKLKRAKDGEGITHVIRAWLIPKEAATDVTDDEDL